MIHELSTDAGLTLKTSKITNFMIFKSVELDFEEKDVVGVLAEYVKDKSRSNRGGKTSLLESIRYNLTGKSRAKTDKELIHYGEKHMLVENVYTDGNTDYVIRRGVDAKGKGILEIDWVTNSAEAQLEINKLFGITPDDIDLTNFFKQADILGFMGMKPAEKTAFLMKYIENQHWSEKEKLANADRAVVKQKIRDNDNLKATLEGGLEVDMSLEGMKSDQQKILEDFKQKLDELKTQSAEVASKIKNLAENKKQINASISKCNSNISDLEAAQEEAEEHEQELIGAKESLSNITKNIKNLNVTRTLAEVEKDKASHSARIDLLKNKINSANKNSGVCPIIRKECDSIKFTADDVSKMKSEIALFESAIKDLDAESQKIESHSTLLIKQEKLKTKINTLQNNKKDTEAIAAKIKKEQKELSALKIKLSEFNVDNLNENQDDLNNEIGKVEAAIESAQKKINNLDVRIQNAKKAKEKIDRLSTDNEKLREELSLLNHTCFMFSKRGIPSGEIENAFGEIEGKINYCLDNLKAGINISFAADKETTEKEPICMCGFEFPKGYKGKDCNECGTPRQFKRREEINFAVVEGTQEKSFDLDSGGGKQIICYSVKIALTYFKRRMNKCRLNMLFLDEVDSALDPYLANQIISSVTNLLTKKLGFKQIIMVSHKEQIKNSMPHVIKVVRHEKHATARFI